GGRRRAVVTQGGELFLKGRLIHCQTPRPRAIITDRMFPARVVATIYRAELHPFQCAAMTHTVTPAMTQTSRGDDADVTYGVIAGMRRRVTPGWRNAASKGREGSLA
ncbi:hypothetical protein, partial [Mesorhizobium sp. M7A.F.Ca.CA.004.02.1.1]